MKDSVIIKEMPLMANSMKDSDGNDIIPTKETLQKCISSPLRTRFADDSGINGEEEGEQEKTHSKRILRQTSSNTSQTNQSGIVSPKRNLNNQKSNNTIPSSVEFKTSTIRQHYYPEGGWGWVVVVCTMFSYIISFGLQLSYAIFLFYLVRQPFGSEKFMSGIWLGSLSLGLSHLISPVVVSWCRRKSARLTAIAGGLMASLGCLFASFGSQFHQVFLSYAIFLSIGVGIARESANIMVGQYFKRRRYFVEIFVQSSLGIGIAFMTPFLSWSIGMFKHWRAGLQLITCSLFATFIIAVLFKPASSYHPQRRAILHLKTQRRKIREKNPINNKPPFFDLTPLKAKSLQLIIVSTFIFSFGYLSPLFYWVHIIDQNTSIASVSQMKSYLSLEVILLYIYFGISLTIGVIIFGYLTVNRRFKTRINKQYLCQISMFLTALSLISNIYFYTNAVTNFVSIAVYGVSIGAFNYSLKMLVYSIMRAKNFGKAWSYVQFTQGIAIFLGIPLSGHINVWFNESSPYYGFLFSCLMCLSGTLLLLALNPEFKNISQNLSDKLHELHHHSCNASSDIQHLNALASPNADSGIQSNNDVNHCCNCGQRLLLNEDNEPFKEYQSMIKTEDTIKSTTITTRATDPTVNESDDDDDDEEDEEFVKLKLENPELATYFSDDLYNYYLQNDAEEGTVLFDPNKDKIIANEMDCLHSRKHLLVCDSIEDKLKPPKRVIETVTEETSSIN